MKTIVVLFAVILEIAFIVYCIHMTYLLDVLDPLPREWLIPNFLIGAAILTFGYVVAFGFNHGVSKFSDGTFPDRT